MSEEDVFEINDFSTSSDWERFIADLEEILTQWNLGGAGDDVSPIDEVPKTDVITAKLSKLSTATTSASSTSSKLFSDPRLWNQKQEQLKFGKVTFTLTCFTFKREDEVSSIGDDSVVGDLQSGLRRQSSKSNSQALSTNRAWHDMNSTAHDWPASGHPLVRYYGFSQFLVLCPLKSETISTEDRIRHLIGSAAIALNNINCEVPFFAQICQPSRRVYSGVLNLNNGFRTCFDMIQFAEVPHSFQYVSDLMNLFKKKLHSSFSYSSVHRDRSTPTHSPSDGPKVAMSIRFTYILSVWPPQYLLFNGNAPNHPALKQFVYFRADFKPQELLIRPAGFGLVANQYADPLKQIQLATTWPSVAEELITDNAYHTDLQPRNAPRWSLRALFMDQPTKCNKLCNTTEWLRAFADLRYQYKTTLLQACKQQQESSGESEVNVRSALDRLAGPSTDQLFKNVSKNVFSQLERNFFAFDSSTSNVEDTVKFLFDHQEGEKIEESNSNCATALKSAPIGSLSWRIALLLANSFAEQHQISTVALIWSTFVDKLRSHWQECTVLPSLESEPVDAIDYGQCLFHQKLQMLNCCIRQKIKRERQQQQQNSPLKSVNEDDDEGDEDDEFFDCDDEEPERALTDSDKQGQLELLKDSSGEVVNLLDQPNRPIYVPVTQDPAPMTEDHLHKQMQTLASMTSPEESKLKIKLQSAGLLSDMEAFKAANSGARFEDFIRWHSPRDWVELGEEDNNSGGTPNKRESLTKGGIETQFGLSRRMREPNMWLDIWELARAVPVSRQKRLFNYTKEAEEILHWLQTVSVNHFVELLGPIVAKATLGQILQYRDEIRTFVGDNLTEQKDLLLITDLLPFDFGTFEAHFSRGDYDGICLELSAVEYDVVKFYSLLKKVIFAYESEVKKPFKDLYVTVPPLKEEPNVTKQAGVRSGPNRPSFKTGPRSTVSSLTSFQKGDLIQFVTRLLLEPEVEFPSSNCMSTLVVRLFVDSARFQYESSTSVGDRIRMSPEDEDFDHDAAASEHLLEGEQQPKKPTMHVPTPQLPPPAGREFIFRAAAIARPAPYSRPSSQRLYCLMSPKNDFRIATAFTEDVAYF